MKVGLFFGTFNPVHVGHLIIANYMATETDLDQVWFIVSPQNPLKTKKALLPEFHRLALVRVAIEQSPKLRASNIEFDLPTPSYTITTLAYVQEKYPEHEFSLILGEDNLRNFHKWKNHEQILQNHNLYVYPRAYTDRERKGVTEELAVDKMISEHERVNFFRNVPIMKISSSYIRSAIKEGRDVRFLLTEPVYKYVEEMHFYKK